ncbi:MAG TPA: hypothetical protein VFZ75_04225 [Actinomycetota bacterium]|nr:hypothetical protein [Actinomycetota bacterium]
MTTHIEQELRELFRDKAGEAPLAEPTTPAAAPPQVLRRGRRRQLGAVVGSAAVVALVVVGSVAGLQRLLADGPEPLPTGDYEVFERTATIEAFTVTGPSDWYLVNAWPLSMRIAVEGNSGTSEACIAAPGESPVACEDTPGEETSTVLPVPHGLPMIQLSNVDLGLEANACRDGLRSAEAALYVALDAERAIAGIADPSIPPFPPGVGLPPEGDGPCGPGRYARFTVNGEPFFAWIGLGSDVSGEDRAAVETAYERMSAIPDWTPARPQSVTPGYVVAGGTMDDGDAWRLEIRRPGQEIEVSLIEGRTVRLALGPEEWCCASTTDPTETSDVIFGTVPLRSMVALQPIDGGDAIHATILPMPGSLASALDVFFIEGAGGTAGEVVIDGTGSVDTSPAATRSKLVDLSGSVGRSRWSVRFTGSFERMNACIEITMDGSGETLCPTDGSLEGPPPFLHGSNWGDVHLMAGTAPPEVVGIRFTSSTSEDLVEGGCSAGPRGWNDRSVCVIALPPRGEGTIAYLDRSGFVLTEEGVAWGTSPAAGPSVAEAGPLSMAVSQQGPDVCFEVRELDLRRCTSVDLSASPALWAETTYLPSGERSLIVWGAAPDRFDAYAFEGTGFFDEFPIGDEVDPEFPGTSFILGLAGHLQDLCGPTARLLDFEDGDLLYRMPACEIPPPT